MLSSDGPVMEAIPIGFFVGEIRLPVADRDNPGTPRRSVPWPVSLVGERRRIFAQADELKSAVNLAQKEEVERAKDGDVRQHQAEEDCH